MVEAKETKILCGDARWQLVRQTVAQVARQEVTRYVEANPMLFKGRRKSPSDFVVDGINEAINELVRGGQIGAFGAEVSDAVRSQSGNLSDTAFLGMRDEVWRATAGIKGLLKGLDIMIERGILDNAAKASEERGVAASGGVGRPFWRQIDLAIEPVVEDNRFSDFLDTEAVFDVTKQVVDAVRKALRDDFTPNVERILNEGLSAMLTPKKKVGGGSLNGSCILDSALRKAGEQCRYFGEVPAENSTLGELFDDWFRGFRGAYKTKGVLANFPALKNVPVGKWVSLEAIARTNGVRGVNAQTLNDEFRLFMSRDKNRSEKRFKIEFSYTSYDCEGKTDGKLVRLVVANSNVNA